MKKASMTNRRVSNPVYVGDVKVGGDAPITVQSMTKTDTRDVSATVNQIKGLEEMGCDIIRCAVPDMEAAKALGEIKHQINIPLVSDWNVTRGISNSGPPPNPVAS